MDNLWILFDKASGQIVKTSSAEIENTTESRCAIRIPDEKLIDLVNTDSVSRLFSDFKVSIVDGEIVFNDSRETIIDFEYNKIVPVKYVHRNNTISSDLKLTITSVDNKPVLKVNFTGNPSLKSNQFKNKEVIHLTAKNNIHLHYQSFEIDLTTLDSDLVFDIDRCDYKLLFSNQISFYHRKKLNIVYTIV